MFKPSIGTGADHFFPWQPGSDPEDRDTKPGNDASNNCEVGCHVPSKRTGGRSATAQDAADIAFMHRVRPTMEGSGEFLHWQAFNVRPSGGFVSALPNALSNCSWVKFLAPVKLARLELVRHGAV